MSSSIDILLGSILLGSVLLWLSHLVLSHLVLSRLKQLAQNLLVPSLRLLVLSLLALNLLAPNRGLKLRNLRPIIGNLMIIPMLECGKILLVHAIRDMMCAPEARNLHLMMLPKLLKEVVGVLVTLLDDSISLLDDSISPMKLQVEGLLLDLQVLNPI